MPRSPQQIADHAAKLDHFAELLSLDVPIPQIMQRMGVSRGATNAWMRKLRTKFGWQAA